MFCPTCRIEYRAGFSRCADCDATLVETLPPDPESIPFDEVCTTYNPGDIAVITAILEGDGIDHVFQGETFNRMRPLVDPVRLLVRRDQVERARQILAEISLTWTGLHALDEEPQE
jgi:hypothetical protein